MRFPLKPAGGIQARMFLILCIAVIPTFVGLGFYAYHNRDEIIYLSRNSTQNYVDLVARHESWLLRGYEQALRSIGATRVVQQRDWLECDRYISRLATPHSPYVNVGVVGLDGQLLCSGRRPTAPKPGNVSDRSYFQRALRQPGFVVSDFLEGRFSHQPTLVIATALELADGGPRVVLYAALDLKELSRAQHDVQLDKAARLTITDRNGTVLYSTQPTLKPGQKLDDAPMRPDSTRDGPEATSLRDSRKWFVTRAPAGTDNDPSALTIVYEYPAAPLVSAVDRELLIGVATLLIITLLALVAGWQSTQILIGRDIKHLVEAAKRLRKRDFSGKLAGKVTGRELSDIAQQFDEMSEELQFHEKQWEAAVRKQTGQNTILRRVARNEPLNETLTALVTFVQEQAPPNVAAVVLLQPGTRQIALCLGPDLPPDYRNALIGCDASPLIHMNGPNADNTSISPGDVGTDPLWPGPSRLAPNDNLRACWSAPIISANDVLLGAFAFYRSNPHTPTDEESRLGQTAAELAAVAIDRDRTSRALVQSEVEYRLLFETNPHPMWVYNAKTLRIMAVNNRAIAHYGYSRGEFLRKRISDLIVDAGRPGEQEAAVPNLIAQTHRTKGKQDILVEIAYFPLHFMGQQAILALINDITEQRQHSEALQYGAKHDLVTGLLNRVSFTAHVNDTIAAAKSADAPVYLIVLSLNEFKEINTSLGYALGDALLKEAGERIQLVAGSAPVARMVSDEFAILLGPGTHSTTMLQTIDGLLAQVKRPFLLNDTQIQVTACIGIAQYPSDGQSMGLLLQHANSAMFQARQESSGYAFYDMANDHLAPERVLLASQLQRGLNEHRFELRYQPKVPLHEGLPYGFEALVRWNSPDSGQVSPDKFISVVESSDLIHPFTHWVLNSAVEECMKWHAHGYHISVAANVSARNLLDSLLPERIKQILTRHALAPKYLELEITESSIMSNPERSLNVLRKIHDIGVGISIDDFGTGYSSLAYLQKLPVDSLKIDRSFVVEMDREDDTRPIINSIIEMAHSLGITVTAEGIESRQIMAKLAGMNCDFAQGYHISEPMAADNVLDWLKRNIPDTPLPTSDTQ